MEKLKCHYSDWEKRLTIGNQVFVFKNEIGKLLATHKALFKDFKNLFDVGFDVENVDRWNSESGYDIIRTYFDKIGEHKTPVKPQYYPSIRYEINRFWENKILSCPLFRGGTFLDIGSCNGEKLAVAKLMGFGKVMGIEISSESCNLARKVFEGEPDVEIYNKDAFDAGDVIKKADIIYTYVPIADKKLMMKLYIHIVKNLKVGAIHVEVAGSYFHNLKFNQSCVDKKRFDYDHTAGLISQKINNKQIKIIGINELINIKTIKPKTEKELYGKSWG